MTEKYKAIGNSVCTMRTPLDPRLERQVMMIAECHGDSTTKEEDEANARLMARALNTYLQIGGK